jgi:small-conductance mechanosensitive channel
MDWNKILDWSGEHLLLPVVIFLAFWLLSRLAARGIGTVTDRLRIHKSVRSLMQRAARLALVIVGGIVALGTAGLDVSALVAGLGLGGFALGFALRDMLANLCAGVMILIHRPFSEGDVLEVAGKSGTVRHIDLRYTELEDDDKTVLIPNQTTLSQVIVKQAGNS